MKQSITHVSVVGLGKLGAPLAACLAHKGFTVVGVDLDESKVAALAAGRAPVYEPGLAALIAKNRERLSATRDIQDAVQNSQATFVVVPTPSGADGAFSLRYVLPAMQAIGQALKHKADYHLISLTSTVMPGATGTQVLPMLEAESGKRVNADFGLCYSPEFIALGSVIRDMLNPDFILIGQSDERAGNLLTGIYQRLCDNQPPIAPMTFVNAELTKIAVNTFVTTKISYANMLAQVCENLPGADADVVTSALGLDTRIGKKYLKGAIGYGGPCFPRDNVAFATLAQRVGTRALLAEATDQTNRQQIERLANVVRANLPANGRAGILGLSYKPNTDVVEESQGVMLAQWLRAQGIETIVYDPAAMANAHRSLADKVHFAESAADCAAQADVIIITTPWDEFRQLEPDALNHSSQRKTVVDCWRILDRARFESFVNYIALGIGPQNAL
jgi:UDPglucose 6-dehydrogenase